MKICLAQTQSLENNINENIKKHLLIIERAILLKSDFIVFPELSITGYEPELANALATTIENTIFDPFQDLSDKNNICIGIGMPTKSNNETYISMLIFQSNKKRVVYSKQLLDNDELPYFCSGTHHIILTIKDTKIALGICYETLQKSHILNAKQNGADIYIASVAKSQNGIEKAINYFPKTALEYNTPILMVNCIGENDNFLSAGQSTIWNKKGTKIKQLDDKNEGLLIYETEFETAKIHQTQIVKGQKSDFETLFQIYINGKIVLDRDGIYQWTNNYPTLEIIKNDLKKGHLYTLKNDNEILGAITISEEQEPEYQSVQWKFKASKVLVIHRLVVNPKHQKQGYGQQLMDFAEQFAANNEYSSIRLDVYSQNKKVLDFYKKRNYYSRGDVNFPERTHVFHCLEKQII